MFCCVVLFGLHYHSVICYKLRCEVEGNNNNYIMMMPQNVVQPTIVRAVVYERVCTGISFLAALLSICVL